MSDTPTPGGKYIVSTGDTYQSIAVRAYGDGSKWPLIQKANAGSSINPGDAIVIPPNQVKENLKSSAFAHAVSGKQKDVFTLIVDGMEIPVVTGRVLRAIENASDAWTAEISWVPGKNPELDRRIRPYGYKPAKVYLGNTLVVTGFLYTTEPTFTDKGTLMYLHGFSKTADAVDSVIKPPYERNNVTLHQRAKELCEPLGIKVIYNVDTDGIFTRIKTRPEETIFKCLLNLASQRGILITSNPNGDMVFERARTTGKTVGVLQEGFPPMLPVSASFNGRERFNVYRAIGQNQGHRSNAMSEILGEVSKPKSKVGIAVDNNVPRSRFMTFHAHDTTAGNIQAAAEWQRSKQLADALSIPVSVSGWYAPDGTLWKENTLVTLVSPTLHLPSGFTFLVKSAEFTFEDNGTKTQLSLVPPQTYTAEPLKDPWA
jgi:prophage tail gpP-like protein